MDFEKILQRLQTHVATLQAVYVFGSQARGDADAHSDLDIAVLAQGRIDPLELWHLAGELSDIAHVPVDLIDLRAASTVMQSQVINSGSRLWGDHSQASLFEAYALNDKLDLDVARAGVLRDIQKDGNVYGR